ncbi:hypothetical protein TrLO_g8699 [Triparma laevis f. longispina]|nr:hypothetical protein TrLO_g8699 [Triparma laevis f. longispina]
MVRRDDPELALKGFKSYVLPSQMNREVVVAEIDVGGRGVQIATAHLESLDATRMREEQLKYILGGEVLGEGGERLLVVDMNFDEGSQEENEIKDGWIDVWKKIGKGDGCTMPMDDHVNRPTRIDRVFGNLTGLEPQVIERVGLEGFEVNGEEKRGGERGGERTRSRSTSGEGLKELAKDLAQKLLAPSSPKGSRKGKGQKKQDAFAVGVMELENISDHFGLMCDFEFVHNNKDEKI